MNQFASLEPEDRRELLRQTGLSLGLNVLIETGTNSGLTPLALLNDFKKIFTIELDKDLWERANSLFARSQHVECLWGDSTDVLLVVLSQVDEPALVWLDGHYSGPGTAHGVESSPIREELRILFEDGRPHVILVDDARIFEGGPEHELYPHYARYPSLRWVQELAEAANYDYELMDDIVRLTPNADYWRDT